MNLQLSLPATLLATLAAGLMAMVPAHATDIGVSIGIDQPGVYGRIDIGRFPQPQVIVAQPVVIQRPRQLPPPVYLHVPPGHRKDWRRWCSRYDACGAPVYFVEERWYQEHVARGDGRDDRHPGRGHGRGNGHGQGHHGRD